MGDLKRRQDITEELKDILGKLKFGRSDLTIGSELYRDLKKEINKLLKFLEEHSGEEDLEPEDRETFKERIDAMHEAASRYVSDKFENGKHALDSSDYLSVRIEAAQKLITITAGEDNLNIQPMELEQGDELQTDEYLKRKQKIRYLAKKQINNYQRQFRELPRSKVIKQDEFDALMDLPETEKILNYKDDAELCQKYPSLRIMLMKAIYAKRKLADSKSMKDSDLNMFLDAWVTKKRAEALAAAEKSIERATGREATEKEMKNEEEKINLMLENKRKAFSTILSLTEKGDELEVVADFLDHKMRIISHRLYVKRPDQIGKVATVEEIEARKKEYENTEDYKFYESLGTLKVYEFGGIYHKRDKVKIEKNYYQKVNETVHTTFKRELFGFKMNRPAFQGVQADNSMIGNTDSSSTGHWVRYGGDAKARVGKIGLKLHNKNKTFQISGGVVAGQIKANALTGVSWVHPGADALVVGEGAALKARLKVTAGNEYIKGSLKGSFSAGYAFGLARTAVGNISIKVDEETEKPAYGFSKSAGVVLSTFKASGGFSINILGFQLDVSLSGYGAAIGAQVGGELAVGRASLTLAGALGIGAGLYIGINWTDAWARWQKTWQKSRLKKVIDWFKTAKAEQKKAKEEEKERARQQKLDEDRKSKDIEEDLGLFPEEVQKENLQPLIEFDINDDELVDNNQRKVSNKEEQKKEDQKEEQKKEDQKEEQKKEDQKEEQKKEDQKEEQKKEDQKEEQKKEDQKEKGPKKEDQEEKGPKKVDHKENEPKKKNPNIRQNKQGRNSAPERGGQKQGSEIKGKNRQSSKSPSKSPNKIIGRH